MSKARVLVVDDSVVMRRVLRDVIGQQPCFEVSGAAANGKIALAMIEGSVPDVVVLDIEMPEMDGLTTLRRLRESHPKLPVIMFSTLTERAAAATIDALALGANDYVTKPTRICGTLQAIEQITNELIPKLKALCTPKDTRPIAARPCAVQTCVPATRRQRIELVAVATSTGGPNALGEVIPRIPPDFEVPIVIVQHMPPIFTRLLAERLTAISRIPVCEAKGSEILDPATAWIAPGDFHVRVERDGRYGRLILDQGPHENSCRPSADVLLRSAAKSFGAGVLAVVMTGMGRDGLLGCEAVCAAGGRVIVQDEASSVVWGMPGFVARAGLAEMSFDLREIGNAIVRTTAESRRHVGAAS